MDKSLGLRIADRPTAKLEIEVRERRGIRGN
jgi:hypothetical protein